MTAPMTDRKARAEADVISLFSNLDCRGLVGQLINRVETRVGSLGACAYAGRHILKVLLDTSVWACHPGRPVAAERPWRTVEEVVVGDKKVLFPIPPRSEAWISSSTARTVPFAEGVTWRGPTTRSSGRSHECVFASGPVW